MVQLDKVSIKSGNFSLNAVHLAIEKGACAVIQGRSGSGKSTVMEAICGLRDVVSGKIIVEDRDVTQMSPSLRNVGLVPQDNVLFPTMTVAEHLGYGPKLKKWSRKDVRERVSELAEALQINHLLHRKPKGLSGGEAKRVAIGRAMAARPALLCLDESFTGLDDETRGDVMRVVKAAIVSEGQTTLLITHQRQEAEYMGDTRYVLKLGVLGRA